MGTNRNIPPGDGAFLAAMEADIDPKAIAAAQEAATEGRSVPKGSVEVIGFGEISCILRSEGSHGRIWKRLPLFRDHAEAERYARSFHEYSAALTAAGLELPAQTTTIIDRPGMMSVLYIGQEELRAVDFCHSRVRSSEASASLEVIDRVVHEIAKIWEYNRHGEPALRLALDGQLSNWAIRTIDAVTGIVYVDTGTPLFRKYGIEQLEPEILIRSTPGFLRWILRLFFLKDVMERYYDLRFVLKDLAANLYKEGRSDLVVPSLAILNGFLPPGLTPFTVKEIDDYYREDRLIWTLFLGFRRFDRFVKSRLLGLRYDFILPGRIKR
jgi:hypothetical protein